MQRTVAASAACAVAAVAILSVLGHPLFGLALGAGLLIGSVNGLLIQRAFSSGAGFRAASMARLAVLTVAGLGVASLFGLPTGIWVLLGLAGAQLLLAGLAITETVRT